MTKDTINLYSLINFGKLFLIQAICYLNKKIYELELYVCYHKDRNNL